MTSGTEMSKYLEENLVRSRLRSGAAKASNSFMQKETNESGTQSN